MLVMSSRAHRGILWIQCAAVQYAGESLRHWRRSESFPKAIWKTELPPKAEALIRLPNLSTSSSCDTTGRPVSRVTRPSPKRRIDIFPRLPGARDRRVGAHRPKQRITCLPATTGTITSKGDLRRGEHNRYKLIEQRESIAPPTNKSRS